MLRLLTWLVSIALHWMLALVLLRYTGGAALMSGSGDDVFVVEAGVAIEGVDRLGPDLATIDAVDAPPVELSEARPEIKESQTEPVEELPPPEFVAAELPRDTKVIQSPEGPEEEPLRPKEPEKD